MLDSYEVQGTGLAFRALGLHFVRIVPLRDEPIGEAEDKPEVPLLRRKRETEVSIYAPLPSSPLI